MNIEIGVSYCYAIGMPDATPLIAGLDSRYPAKDISGKILPETIPQMTTTTIGGAKASASANFMFSLPVTTDTAGQLVMPYGSVRNATATNGNGGITIGLAPAMQFPPAGSHMFLSCYHDIPNSAISHSSGFANLRYAYDVSIKGSNVMVYGNFVDVQGSQSNDIIIDSSNVFGSASGASNLLVTNSFTATSGTSFIACSNSIIIGHAVTVGSGFYPTFSRKVVSNNIILDATDIPSPVVGSQQVSTDIRSACNIVIITKSKDDVATHMYLPESSEGVTILGSPDKGLINAHNTRLSGAVMLGAKATAVHAGSAQICEGVNRTYLSLQFRDTPVIVNGKVPLNTLPLTDLDARYAGGGGTTVETATSTVSGISKLGTDTVITGGSAVGVNATGQLRVNVAPTEVTVAGSTLDAAITSMNTSINNLSSGKADLVAGKVNPTQLPESSSTALGAVKLGTDTAVTGGASVGKDASGKLAVKPTSDNVTFGANTLTSTINSINATIAGLQTNKADVSAIADLEASIADVETSVNSKASKATVDALSDTVTGFEADITTLTANKADKTELTTITDTLTDMDSRLTHLGDTKAEQSDFTDLVTTVDSLTGRLSTIETGKADLSYVDANMAGKANKAYVDTQLETKADTTYVNTQLTNKVSTTQFDAAIATKANASTVDRVVADVAALQANKADLTYVNTQLATKASATELAALSTAMDTTIAKVAGIHDMFTPVAKIVGFTWNSTTKAFTSEFGVGLVAKTGTESFLAEVTGTAGAYQIKLNPSSWYWPAGVTSARVYLKATNTYFNGVKTTNNWEKAIGNAEGSNGFIVVNSTDTEVVYPILVQRRHYGDSSLWTTPYALFAGDCAIIEFYRA